MESDDPLEKLVAAALLSAGIEFVHESDGKKHSGIPLDFYLPASDVYIECKQFHTDRVAGQMAYTPNVILIQGRTAAETFAKLITARSSTG